MRRHFSTAICITIGSLALYCGQSTLNVTHSPDGGIFDGKGVVTDAQAQMGCCTPTSPVYTKLWEGDLKSGALTSPDISVGAYKEVILYFDINSYTTSINCNIGASFRPNATTLYSETMGLSSGAVPIGRMQVQGTDMKLRVFDRQGAGCPGFAAHYVVAGVQ